MNKPLIALIFDSDKTLTPEYMQKPIFDFYGLSSEYNDFWVLKEKTLADKRKQGYNIDGNMVWLNMLLDYAHNNKMPGLSNELLMDLGSMIEFFDGLPEFFPKIRAEFKEEVDLEFYVITSGLRKMVQGSSIAEHLTSVWGCEYDEREGVISHILLNVDFSNKTRYLFAISKGDELLVNERVREKRIPWEHMVYVGDGATDIPCFTVMKQKGGHSIAVHNPQSKKAYDTACKLMRDERVGCFCEADYRVGSDLYNEFKKIIREIIHIT